MATVATQRIAVADVQLFVFDDRRYIKEVAVCGENYNRSETFKPPFPYEYIPPNFRFPVHRAERKTGIAWQGGYHHPTDTSNIIKQLFDPFDKIFVRGLVKHDVLSQYHDRVYLYPSKHLRCVGDDDGWRESDNVVRCNNHINRRGSSACALTTAYFYYDHLKTLPCASDKDEEWVADEDNEDDDNGSDGIVVNYNSNLDTDDIDSCDYDVED